MKKAILVLLVLSLMLSACATFKTPGQDNKIKTNLEAKKYDMLGDVKIEGTLTSIMGLFTWGGATYNELLEKARKEYKADEVINISEDIKNTIFLGIYFSQTYVLRGVAIKYK